MTNNQYISTLKKALSSMDRNSRNDIVQEIQSHAAESGTPLFERFGSPEELAKQYLDGEIVAKPVAKKIMGVGKRLFTWIGIVLVMLIAAVALFVWAVSKDDFNYADENAPELSDEKAQWVSQEWDAPLTIKLDQSSGVFYWHDAKTVRWSCLGAHQPVLDEQATLNLRQSKCLVYLPKTALTLEGDQSQVVLIRPQVSVDAKLHQTRLRIAENGAQYRYDMSGSRMKFEDLQSHDDAEWVISVRAEESMIGPYAED